MAGLDEIVIKIAGILLLLYGYALAMRDWGAGVADELEDALHGALKRRALHWAAAAAALLALVMLVQWYIGGMAIAVAYISGPGSFLLMQIGALLVLLPVGGAWAVRLGRRPLGGVRETGAIDAATEPTLRSYMLMRMDFLWLGMALLAMLFWTVLLAKSFPHHALASLPGRFGGEASNAALAWPLVMALLTLAPIIEEFFFRLYLLHRIAGAWQGRSGGAVVAIITSALAFGLAHYGQLDPFWLKFVQSAGLGCILGVVAWQRGVEASIALHWLFNLSLIPFSWLLR